MSKNVRDLIVIFLSTMAIISGSFMVTTSAKAATTTLKVMPLGDSITVGIGDGSTGGLNDGYRCALKNLIQAGGQPIDYVGSQSSGPTQCTGHDIQHEGHSGWTSTQIRDNVGAWVTSSQPDVVLLMIGTNDIKLRQWAGLNERVGQIIDNIHTAKPDAVVIVSSIVQYNYMPPLAADLVAAWNAYRDSIPSIAVEHDAFAAYNSNIIQRMLADGLHPNACAYDNLMSYNWYGSFQQAVPAPNGAGWVPQYPKKSC